MTGQTLKFSIIEPKNDSHNFIEAISHEINSDFAGIYRDQPSIELNKFVKKLGFWFFHETTINTPKASLFRDDIV
jgi:hypothetical protein